MEELSKIQAELNAPKRQFNKFGGYAYRNAEDILEALKPHLRELGCVLTLSDEIVAVGNRIYVKATATLAKGTKSVSSSAYAREAESKKGMDEAQVTGAASSYARKYALNGLFAIDDTKDPDELSARGVEESANKPTNKRPRLNEGQVKELRDLLRRSETNEDNFLKFMEVASLEEAPFEQAKNALLKKLTKLEAQHARAS